MTTGKTIALTIWTFVSKVMSLRYIYIYLYIHITNKIYKTYIYIF